MARAEGLAALLAKKNGASVRGRLHAGMFAQVEGPADSAPLVRNIYPPWVFKLPMSKDFNRNAFTTVLAAGATAELVSYQIPQAMVGWVQIFGIYILSPTALQSIVFTLRINGGPVEGWDNIVFPPGVANFIVQNFSELQERVPNSGLITVTAMNNGVGAFTVGAKISGWYHPETEEQRIYGAL